MRGKKIYIRDKRFALIFKICFYSLCFKNEKRGKDLEKSVKIFQSMDSNGITILFEWLSDLNLSLKYNLKYNLKFILQPEDHSAIQR